MIDFCRRVGFYILDGLRGGAVRNACHELKKWDHTDAQSEELVQYHRSCIQQLMDHARKTTPYYADIDAAEFEDLPVIDKGIIKENQSAFLSTNYTPDKLIKMYTSGSTGTPLISYQDVRKKKKVNAECIYYSQKVGYDVGAPLIYLRAAVKQITKSALKQFIQNQPLLSCKDLSDAGIDALLQHIADIHGNKKTMIAYASTYDAIADYLERTDCAPNRNSGMTGLISGAEMLYDQTRTALENYFGCRCVSRYSNEENGVLAQDDLINNQFLINEAHYYIEILKMESNEPAEEGEVGRVVVTDLFNYAMPMLRYDTGDIGAIEIVQYGGVNHRAITKFGGRKCDRIFDVNNNRISSHAVTNLMWSYTEVRQFQFVQLSAKKYVININCDSTFTRESELVCALKQLMGVDADISVEYASEIPVLRSGKRKYIVNKMLEG